MRCSYLSEFGSDRCASCGLLEQICMKKSILTVHAPRSDPESNAVVKHLHLVLAGAV